MSTDPRLYRRQRRNKLRDRAIQLKGGKCEICGYDACAAAFDFHHPNDLLKEGNISSLSSWKKIEAEIANCVLLCSRCHREVHDGLHAGYIADPRYD